MLSYRSPIRSWLPFIAVLLLCATAVSSCANKGAPEGGPFDQTAPSLQQAIPVHGSLSVKGKTIRLKFDENIRVKNQLTKVTLSPPQAEPPKILANGRAMTIQLQEELQPNTTYVVDFMDAIVDTHEETPIEDFVYAFSSGEHLDDLQISGVVVDARTLEPMEGLRVGVHTDLSDTVLRSKPFFRLATTRKDGRFTLRYLPDSCYRVYALQDMDRNYMLSSAGEGLAFDPETFCSDRPPMQSSSASDTTAVDTTDLTVSNSPSTLSPARLDGSSKATAADSIMDKQFVDSVGNKYSASDSLPMDSSAMRLPRGGDTDTAMLANSTGLTTADSAGLKRPAHMQNIVLRYFQMGIDTQKLHKYERPDSSFIVLTFATPIDELPKLNILNSPEGQLPELSPTPFTNGTNTTDSLRIEGQSMLFSASNTTARPRHETQSQADSLPFPQLKSRPNRPHPHLAIARQSETSIRYDFLSSRLSSLDSISMEVSYPSIDSLRRPVTCTDTLLLRKPKVKEKPAERKKEGKLKNDKESKASTGKDQTSPTDSLSPAQKNRIDPSLLFDITTTRASALIAQTPSDSIHITLPRPTLEPIDHLLLLEVEEDSVWIPYRNYRIEAQAQNECVYHIVAPWEWDKHYRLTINEGSLHDYYGLSNKEVKYPFDMGKEEEFGSLELTINPTDSNMIIELLDASDQVQMTTKVQGNKATFPHIKAGNYYARLFVDSNRNGRWDTGHYPDRLPELVRYYPNELLVKGKWTTGEEWYTEELPIDEQKPIKLRKNKPEEKEKKDLNEEYWRRMEQRNFKRPHKKVEKKLQSLTTTDPSSLVHS